MFSFINTSSAVGFIAISSAILNDITLLTGIIGNYWFMEKLQKKTNWTESSAPSMLMAWFADAWWRHQMEKFSALLAICAGNSPVPGEFPAQRPVTRSFGVFFDLRPNKRLSKQSWGWWFETPSRPLWRHRNGLYAVSLVRAVYIWDLHLSSCGQYLIVDRKWVDKISCFFKCSQKIFI